METLEVLADTEAMQMLQDSLADIRHGRVFDQEDVERELLGLDGIDVADDPEPEPK